MAVKNGLDEPNPYKDLIDKSKLPKHIAIIMDGNGRWASERGLARIEGHKRGIDAIEEVVKASVELGIAVLTLYAFSTENWNRPRREIKALMDLLLEFLKREEPRLMKNNIRLMTIGRVNELPAKVIKQLEQVVNGTHKNTGLVLALALNYSGRSEIVDAVKKIGDAIHEGKATPESINETFVSNYLYTAGLPDPDLLIRTSGEVRVSNFLLWQISYAEIFISNVLWPSFRAKDLHEAIVDFQKRERRFGGIPNAK